MLRPMEGGGVYDHHNEYQMRSGFLHAELVATAASVIVPDERRGSVVLVDYGCPQGRVSNPLIRTAIERLCSGGSCSVGSHARWGHTCSVARWGHCSVLLGRAHAHAHARAARGAHGVTHGVRSFFLPP